MLFLLVIKGQPGSDSFYQTAALFFVKSDQAHAGHWLFDPLCESFDQHLFHNMKGKVKILESTLNGRERDVLGASVLAWNVKEYSLFK